MNETLKQELNKSRAGYGIRVVDDKFDYEGEFKDVMTVDAAYRVAHRHGLNVQYSLLSELLEQFPNTSRHRAALVIHKRMEEILKQINELNTQANEQH